MGNENWVIAGKTARASRPIVGKSYEVRDARKGTFNGRVLSVDGYWAEVEVLDGDIHWASNENRMFNARPTVVSIRASLSYLIPLPPANKRAQATQDRRA